MASGSTAGPYSARATGYRVAPVVGPPTLGATALEAIRSSILRGRFGLGERLVEATLSRDLGISRGPLREALTLLEKEGLVENIPRRGRFVTQITPRSLDEHYRLRKILEVQAVTEVIGALNPRKERLLEGCLRRLADAAGGDDALKLALADLTLHDTLYQLSENDLLLKVWQENVAVKLRLLINMTGKTHAPTITVDNHRRIVDAIIGRDTRMATLLIEDHVDDASRRARESLSRARQLASNADLWT
ncbi:MAG: GntR family transcriptional regulator [Candidatus Dormiibacterota bacterium]